MAHDILTYSNGGPKRNGVVSSNTSHKKCRFDLNIYYFYVDGNDLRINKNLRSIVPDWTRLLGCFFGHLAVFGDLSPSCSLPFHCHDDQFQSEVGSTLARRIRISKYTEQQ